MAVDLSRTVDQSLGGRQLHHLQVAAMLAFGFAGAAAMAMWRSSFGTSLAILVCYGVVAAGLVSRELGKWGRRGLVSPIAIYAVFWFAYNALPLPLAVLSSGTFGGAKAEPLWLNVAGLVSLASLLLVAAGHAVGSRLYVGRRLHAPELTLQLAVLIAAIGWGTRFYLVATGGYGYLSFGSSLHSGPSQTLLSLGSVLVPLSTAALGYLVWKPDGTNRLAGLILPGVVVATALGGLVSGFKAQVFTDLIPLFIVYMYVRRRVPWKPVLLILLYIALIRFGVEEFRADLSGGQLEGDAGVTGSTQAVLDRVIEGAGSQSLGQQVADLVEHLADEYQQVPDNLALILSRTGREIPFLGSKRALLEPIPLIPISVANEGQFSVTQYVNVVYRGGTTTSSSVPGQPGDLYMSAGWPAVVIGELVIGVVLGLLWGFVWHRNEPGITVLYAMLGASFATAGKEYGLLLRGLAQQGVGLWVALSAMAFISQSFMSGRKAR